LRGEVGLELLGMRTISWHEARKARDNVALGAKRARGRGSQRQLSLQPYSTWPGAYPITALFKQFEILARLEARAIALAGV